MKKMPQINNAVSYIRILGFVLFGSILAIIIVMIKSNTEIAKIPQGTTAIQNAEPNNNVQDEQQPIISNNRYIIPQWEISVTKLPSYTYEFSGNTVTLTNTKGSIQIDFVGTNHSTIEKYLEELAHFNKNIFTDRDTITINMIPAMKTNLIKSDHTTDKQLFYFFYPKEWTVISVTATNQLLQGDVETLAESLQRERQPEK